MPARAAAVTSPIGASYRPRRPEETALYRLLQRHLAPFLASVAREDSDRSPVPSFVRQELGKYLKCGILAHGFSRFRCADSVRHYVALPRSTRKPL